MIKASVMYPYSEGKEFDMKYYCEKHMPLVKERLGPACKGIAVDQGIAGAGGASPTYIAIGHIYFESIEAFQAAFGSHVAEFRADIPNFTSIQPIIQISEVKI
jgi:uncharacterized protein (TIGR02118 family)